MKKSCVIYDSDEQYGKRLMSAFSHRKSLPFGIQLFTREEELSAYLDKNMPELMVVSESCCNYEWEKKHEGRVLILTEEEGNVSKVAKDNFQEVQSIYKYQSTDTILREVIRYSGQQKEENCNIELIGVFSPAQEPLKTSFALSLAKILSESQKTLYVNLEEFSGLEEVLPECEGQNFSDAMYYFRQAEGKITEQMKAVISTSAGVDYIPPVQYVQDLSILETTQIADFISSLAQECGYKKVILEISSAVREQWKLILKCSKVYMPVKEDYLSQKKIMGFEKYLLLSGMEYLWNQIEKISLPQKIGSMKKEYLSSKEGEEMDGFVRNLLAG